MKLKCRLVFYAGKRRNDGKTAKSLDISKFSKPDSCNEGKNPFEKTTFQPLNFCEKPVPQCK